MQAGASLPALDGAEPLFWRATRNAPTRHGLASMPSRNAEDGRSDLGTPAVCLDIGAELCQPRQP
jgi:hypothetical protein